MLLPARQDNPFLVRWICHVKAFRMDAIAGLYLSSSCKKMHLNFREYNNRSTGLKILLLLLLHFVIFKRELAA